MSKKETKKKKKKFNKKHFAISQAILAFCFLGVAIISVASIICAFSVGGGVAGGITAKKGKDPKDYYGKYYGSSDYTYYSVEFNEDLCIYIASNGLQEEKTECEYEYVSAEYAQSRITSEQYEGCPAIFVYTDPNNQSQAAVLWITSTNPYSFTLNANGAKLTTKEISFAREMEDPRNYYSKYTYDSTNYITFNADGTATFSYNGDVDVYLYAFVNKGWLKKYTKYSFDEAIILYQEDNDSYAVFEYISKTELSLDGKYDFFGKGSADKEWEEEEEEDSNDYSSSDKYSSEDESDKGSSTGTPTANTWKNYFNFNDVTIEIKVEGGRIDLLLDNGKVSYTQTDEYGDSTVVIYDGANWVADGETITDIYEEAMLQMIVESMISSFDFSDYASDFTLADEETKNGKKIQYYEAEEIADMSVYNVTITVTNGKITKIRYMDAYEEAVIEATFTKWGSTTVSKW